MGLPGRHSANAQTGTLCESLRQKVALWLAPWLYVPYREDREEAFRTLAGVAYGSRDAIWTSPQCLVEVAMRESRRLGRESRRV